MKNPFTHIGKFIIRQPNYPVERLLECLADPEMMHSALREDGFRRAILWVSEDLYAEYVKFLSADMSKKDEDRMSLTLLKYLCRMSGRSTPFGEFASVGTGSIGEETIVDAPGSRHLWITLDSRYERLLVDRTLLRAVRSKNPDSTFPRYRLNGTLLKKGNYLYLFSNAGEDRYHFQAIRTNALVENLFKRMNRPSTPTRNHS